MLKAAVFSALAAAFVGLIYGWYSLAVCKDQSPSPWSRRAFVLGLCTMTAQILLVIPIYTDLLDRYESFFGYWWLAAEFALFAGTVLLLTVGERTRKWWLIASSAYFLLFCLLIVMDSA